MRVMARERGSDASIRQLSMIQRIRSERVSQLEQSEIRAMTRVCNEVGGVNMGQGICDVPTPQIVKDSSIRAVQDDRSIYTRYDGDEPLRQALASKLSSYNGIQADPETEIVVTVGASGALTSTLVALCNREKSLHKACYLYCTDN